MESNQDFSRKMRSKPVRNRNRTTPYARRVAKKSIDQTSEKEKEVSVIGIKLP